MRVLYIDNNSDGSDSGTPRFEGKRFLGMCDMRRAMIVLNAVELSVLCMWYCAMQVSVDSLASERRDGVGGGSCALVDTSPIGCPIDCLLASFRVCDETDKLTTYS